MNFSADRDAFLGAAQATLRAVLPKSTVPALTGMLITATRDGITLAGTDLEIGIECRFRAQITQEGQVLLPARYLVDIVRRLPEGEVSLTYDAAAEQVFVAAGSSRFELFTLPAADFPAVKPAGAVALARIPELTLRTLIQQVTFAAARDGLRQLLTSVLLSFKQGQLRVVATDGHRLALAEAAVELEGPPGDYLVPARNLEELARLAGGGSEVQLAAAANQLIFTVGESMLVSRLVEGKYLPYESVLPRSFSHRVVVERKAFLAALERADLFSVEKMNAVRLELTSVGIKVFAQSTEIGRLQELVPARVEGEPLEISFNGRYLIEPLRILAAEQVVLEFTGPGSAAVISPAGSKSYYYLVMPVTTRTAA